jgi:hypothetical protein
MDVVIDEPVYLHLAADRRAELCAFACQFDRNQCELHSRRVGLNGNA